MATPGRSRKRRGQESAGDQASADVAARGQRWIRQREASSAGAARRNREEELELELEVEKRRRAPSVRSDWPWRRRAM
jgi:hypothetical protein